MEFNIIKTKNVNAWRVKLIKYDFKEDWIIFATILGFDEPKEFIEHIYENYASSNITREYYRDSKSKKYSTIAGLDIWFTVKKDADNFLKELNGKLSGE